MSDHQLLVVDDDHDVREALQEILEAYGYTVATAYNGRDALDQLRAGLRPCLILIDLMMPEMNGAEFRTAQLEDPALRDIPIVLLTGNTRGPELASVLQADVLKKPFDLHALFAVVRRFCSDGP
jgi:two-component system response regulator MprA